jgi:hypothetical protein
MRFLSILLFVLLLPATAVAQGGPKLEFDLDGYYRARGHIFGNLYDSDFPKDGAREIETYFLEDPAEDIPDLFRAQYERIHGRNYFTSDLTQAYCRRFPDQCRSAMVNPHLSSWFVSRGRFEPSIKMRGITVKATLDVLDNVVWGDNENLASTPLFAGAPSATQTNGDVVDTIQVKRLWAEWSTAFGVIRIGRQPSNWGLGILASDGDGFKQDFGDSYGGAVFDRILFATRPVTLVKGIAAIASGKPMPKPADDPGIIFAIAFDKLVESSAITFRNAISDDDRLADENEGNTRQAPFWLSDQGDDVLEMVYVLVFKREDWKVGNQLMDLTVGGYLINRWQHNTNSNVWIPDVHVRWKMRGVFVEGEVYHIAGQTDAIAPDWDKTTTASITGFVARVGYENPNIRGLFEIGHASGDDVLLDEAFTGRALHQDHNVGLILYEQALAQRTIDKSVGDPDLAGLTSRGGVYNSTYINPRLILSPGDIFEFRLGLVMGWADEVDGAMIPFLTNEDGVLEASNDDLTEDKLLGTEVDLGIHMKWLDDHILIGVEAGFMHAGRRLGRTSQYRDPRDAATPTAYNAAQYDRIVQRLNNVWTLQGRFAFVF